MERSIIIPAYDKEWLITRCLESIDAALAAISHAAHLNYKQRPGLWYDGRW